MFVTFDDAFDLFRKRKEERKEGIRMSRRKEKGMGESDRGWDEMVGRQEEQKNVPLFCRLRILCPCFLQKQFDVSDIFGRRKSDNIGYIEQGQS